MDSKKTIHADFEWEGLQSKKKVARLEHSGKLLSGSSTATIVRDDSYRLTCEIQGFTDSPFGPQLEIQKLRFGAFSFSGDCDGYKSVFSNCYIGGLQSFVDCESGTHKNNSFNLNVHTDFFEQKAAGTWNEVTHIDWFLNGPSDFIFARSVSRQHDKGYSRTVEGPKNYTLAAGSSAPGFDVSCAWVQLPEFAFIVRRVSEEYAPSWSKNFAIEYSTKLSPIPEEKTRKVVAEIVSFVLGRRLIDIGDTSFADEGHEFSMQNWDTEAHLLPVKVKSDLPYLLRSWNPYGINVQALCSKPDFPPIPIERIHRNKNQDVEAVLSKLVPIYLNLRDTLALDHALWRYWTFQEMPLGINLPMLVSGIEILASAWFSSEYSASKGNFTPQKEFLDLLQPDFESIKTKLESASVAEPALERLKNPEVLRALMTRLQNSFEMGPGAKMRRFFEEIGIVPTAEEIEALNSRHRQIHTHEADQEAEKLWLLSEHLRTLFHKIILRLLGYDGEYFNYAKHEVHELNSAPLRLCVKIQS